MTEDMTKPHFHYLTPEFVIKLAEEQLGRPLTNLCRPYQSYINRVYELQEDDGSGIVIKFYRPGRWSAEALQDEHDFLTELAQAEIPIIAPLPLAQGGTLGAVDETCFSIFPKKGGRKCDEFTDDQWLELGRLIGRVHAVGVEKMPRDRITLTPQKATRDHIEYILCGDVVPQDLRAPFTDATDELLALISPLFENKPLTRIHGDCYCANIIYRPGESLYLIDFDDMALGTPIHDVWMLLPGYARDTRRELNLFIEGYETFRHFDYSGLRLIEPLRAMRYIHFTAWCAHQVSDAGYLRLDPNWGNREYWLTEIDDLHDQIKRIREELS